MSFYTALRELLFGGTTITQPFGPSSCAECHEPSCGCGNQPACPPPYAGQCIPHFHMGVDLALPGGLKANVTSPASGKVVAIGTDPAHGYGLFVRILAPNGFTYLLGHLWNLKVVPNQVVHAGDLLGNQGSTGNSTGPHLHFEVRNPAGVPVNIGSIEDPTGKKALDTIWSNIEHGLGFGQGCHPLQWGSDPPDPLGGGTSACLSGSAPHPCPSGQVWDGAKCVPSGGNTGPCPQGFVWDPAQGVCVDTGGGTGTGRNPWTAILAGVTDDQGRLQPNALATAAVGLAGAALLWQGIRKLGQEPPVQIVTSPIREAKEGIQSAGRKAATGLAAIAAPEAAPALIAAQKKPSGSDLPPRRKGNT